MPSASYPKTNAEKAKLYAEAIHEIRVRLRSIEAIIGASLPEVIIGETSHLQLRLCVECFAIACLAAQGDFETHQAFKNEYSPVRIFKALEAVYPDFLPIPSSRNAVAKGMWYFDTEGRGNTITREELERLWETSGKHLHRASAKKYLKGDSKVDSRDIEAAKDRLWGLIADHAIWLADRTCYLHVSADRATDRMQLDFLHLDKATKTAKVEPFAVNIIR